jgi:predicted ATP-binding protein involved in virulence
VRLVELQLKDFRGFRGSHTLDLRSRATVVFAGVNGCGKSSVLDAAASLLAGVPSILVDNRKVLFGNEASNIRTGAAVAVCSAVFRAGEDWAGLELSSRHEPDDSAPSGPDGPPPTFGFLDTWQLALAAGELAVPLPVLTYLHSGSTRTPVSHERINPQLMGRMAAYRGAFEREAEHFDAFATWFEQEENLENQEKISRGTLGYELRTLRAVRRALTTFLTGLHADHLDQVKVVRSHVGGPMGDVQGRLTVSKRGEQLFVDQLSDGERRLVLLVGDVARRMAILQPDAAEPTAGPGIVLVDEIDLHLHPAWQRRVMPALRAAFPGVQLLVSTHSPQVLASVPSEAVVLMKDFEFLPGHPRVQGRDSNTILETVLEVPDRPDEVKADLRAVYDALDDAPRKAKALFRKLKRKLEDDDPELARIQTLLDLGAA